MKNLKITCYLKLEILSSIQGHGSKTLIQWWTSEKELKKQTPAYGGRWIPVMIDIIEYNDWKTETNHDPNE